MSKQLKPRSIIVFILLFVAFGFLIASLSSCSSIRKLKTNVKQTEETKVSEQVVKERDSSTSTMVLRVDSTGTTVTVEFDSSGKDTATTVEVITYPAHKEDYFQPRHTQVKTNRKPKSVVVNQASQKKDAQEIKTAIKSGEAKITDAEKRVVKEEKKLDKEKTNLVWWIWPLAIIIITAIVFCRVYKITPMTALLWIRKQIIKK